jgi:hypothetical protein
LTAASVIGARFEAELFGTLGIDVVFDELLTAELIDQVRFTPSAEYAFRHPLIGVSLRHGSHDQPPRRESVTARVRLRGDR